MLKIFLKFAGYILLKWIIFYIYELAVSSNFRWSNETNYEGIMLTAIMLLAEPILEIIVLILPIHFALKQNGWTMISILVFVFLIEFVIGWYATNQKIEVWMIVKMILSIGLFYYLYRKELTKS
jgi:uncharacterized protein YggT (Ycf19 family)